METRGMERQRGTGAAAFLRNGICLDIQFTTLLHLLDDFETAGFIYLIPVRRGEMPGLGRGTGKECSPCHVHSKKNER